MRPWRPARVSASSLLTRSTTLKKRPRAPRRMQARAIAMAAWLLPVPVPPIRTALRWCSRKSPPARSRTSISFTAAASKSKSSMSLASGSLAIVIWYLIERACLLVDLGNQKVADDPLWLMLPFSRRWRRSRHRRRRMPKSLSSPMASRTWERLHQIALLRLSYRVQSGDRRAGQPQRLWRHDRDRRVRIAAARQNVQDHVGGMDALAQRLDASGLDRGKPVRSARRRGSPPSADRRPRAARSFRRTRSMAAGNTQCLNGGAVAERAGLAGQHRHVVPGIVDCPRPGRRRARAHRRRGRPGAARCGRHRPAPPPADRRRWPRPSTCCYRSARGRSWTPKPAPHGSRRIGRDRARGSPSRPRTPPRSSCRRSPDGPGPSPGRRTGRSASR